MYQKTKTVSQLRRSLTVAALLALGATANAGTLFLSNLSGANEIPAGSGAPNATGLGIIIVNDAGTSSTISANWKGIKGITGGRIHRGTPADNGPVIFPFAAVGNPSAPFTWNLSATALNDMRNGGLFMDITNGDFPDGAIRGQIFRATLAPAATNAAQSRLAGILDVSAGLSPDLDTILIQTNLASREVQAQTLDELSARTAYAPAREQIETMATLTDGLFAQADESRQNPAAASRHVDTFFKGGASFGHRTNTSNQAGSHVSRPFGTIGMEFNYGADRRAGLALSYADGRDRFDGGVGRANTKTTAVNFFLSAPLGATGINLDATVGYGLSNIDYTRNLLSLGRTTSASFEGSVWSGALKASKTFALGGRASVIPYVLVDTQDARLDAHRENGAISADLLIPRITSRNSAVEGGATLLLPFQVSSATVTARVQAGWHYLLEEGDGSFVANLGDAPVSFLTEFDHPGRSTAHVEAALTAAPSRRTLATVGYRGELGADGRTISALEGRVVFQF